MSRWTRRWRGAFTIGLSFGRCSFRELGLYVLRLDILQGVLHVGADGFMIVGPYFCNEGVELSEESLKMSLECR